MNNLRIASVQFEPKDGNKEYNLGIIESIAEKAASLGAEIVSFHELSITAYTYLKDLSIEELDTLAEEVTVGTKINAVTSPSLVRLDEISKKFNIAIMAGLVEKDNGKYYNTYVVVNDGKVLAKHRKIHPFISKHLSAGNQYTVFELNGWKCGILICYDNNIIENVRATVLLGADIIFAPHVTGLTPSAMPGRGFVDDKLWKNRYTDPVPLKMELNGPKGRAWLMRWLPSRAYDNGVYYIFSNPIGYDGDQLKNGNAMIIDPYGEIMDEVNSFENGFAISTITSDKLKLAGGFRYRNARRPELYREILGAEHDSVTKPVWMK